MGGSVAGTALLTNELFHLKEAAAYRCVRAFYTSPVKAFNIKNITCTYEYFTIKTLRVHIPQYHICNTYT